MISAAVGAYATRRLYKPLVLGAAVVVVGGGLGLVQSLTVLSGGMAAATGGPCGGPPVVALGSIKSKDLDSLPFVGTASPTSAESRQIAQVAINEAKRLGLPMKAAVIAVATGMQESGLRNLTGGDRDSAGWLQQRPSTGWGTYEQVRNITLATDAFYGKAAHTSNPGLTQIPEWELMPVTVAAQRVQRSAFPDAYAKWEKPAAAIVEALVRAGGGTMPPLGSSDDPCPGGAANVAMLPGNDAASKAVNAALTKIGVPYSWGGGGPNGPSEGFAQGAGIIGFDCSALMQFAWWQGAKLMLPRTTGEQWDALPHVSLNDARPGDMLHFHGHVMMVVSTDGTIVHSPSTGKPVQVVKNMFAGGSITNSYWAPKFVGVARAWR